MNSHEPNEARVIPLRPAAAPAVTPVAKEPLWRHLVGEVLRRERLAQERTLKDVADEARISMPYLSELERGRKEASSEVLAAAARALGLGLADLLALTQRELARLASARAAEGRALLIPVASRHDLGPRRAASSGGGGVAASDSAVVSDSVAVSDSVVLSAGEPGARRAGARGAAHRSAMCLAA